MRKLSIKLALLAVSGLGLTFGYGMAQAVTTCTGTPPSGFGNFVAGKFTQTWQNAFSASSSGCICTAVSEKAGSDGGQDFILYNTCAKPVNLSSEATSVGLYTKAASPIATIKQTSGSPSITWTVTHPAATSAILLPSKTDDSISLANGASAQFHVAPSSGTVGEIDQVRPTTAPAFTNWDTSHNQPACLHTAYAPSIDGNDTFIAVQNTCGKPQAVTHAGTYISAATQESFGSIENIFTPYLPASAQSAPFTWITDPQAPNHLINTSGGADVTLDSAANHNTLILKLDTLAPSGVQGITINAPQTDAGWTANPCLQALYEANVKITKNYTRSEPSFTVTNVCAEPVTLMDGLRLNLDNDYDASTGMHNVLFQYAQNESTFSGNFSQIGSYPSTQKIKCSAPTGTAGSQTCPATATEYAIISGFNNAQYQPPILKPGKSFNFSLYSFGKVRAPKQIFVEATTQKNAVPSDLQTATVANAAFPGKGYPEDNPKVFLKQDPSHTLYDLMAPWGNQVDIPLSPLYQPKLAGFVSTDYLLVPWDYKNIDSKTGDVTYFGNAVTPVQIGQKINLKYKQLVNNATLKVKTTVDHASLASLVGPDLTIVNASRGGAQSMTHEFKLSDSHTFANLINNRSFALSTKYSTFDMYPRGGKKLSYYDCIPKETPPSSMNTKNTPLSLNLDYACTVHPSAVVKVSTDLSEKVSFPITILDLTHPQVLNITSNVGSTKVINATLRVGDQYAVNQIRIADKAGNVYKGVAAPVTVAKSGSKMVIHFTKVKSQYTPYTDITTLVPGPSKTQTFAFLTALNNQCSPGWAMVPYDSKSVSAPLPVIQKYVDAGNKYYLSFGGASGQLLMQACPDTGSLVAQYDAIYKLYNKNMLGFDFDIEGGHVLDTASITRGAQALAQFQQTHPDVDIWLTLPTMPNGLTADGQEVVHIFHQAGVVLAGVNIMAMDYGPSAQYPSDKMGDYAVSAANGLVTQLKAEYKGESDALIWSMVGVTPMIGYNDTGQVYSLADTTQLLNALKGKNIGRMAMWSTGRDHPCKQEGEVTYTCSGLLQKDAGDNAFGDILKNAAGSN